MVLYHTCCKRGFLWGAAEAFDASSLQSTNRYLLGCYENNMALFLEETSGSIKALQFALQVGCALEARKGDGAMMPAD